MRSIVLNGKCDRNLRACSGKINYAAGVSKTYPKNSNIDLARRGLKEEMTLHHSGALPLRSPRHPTLTATQQQFGPSRTAICDLSKMRVWRKRAP